MLRELENTGLAGGNGEETTLLRGTTELILREGPHLAPFGERGERDPHPASPKGRGEEGAAVAVFPGHGILSARGRARRQSNCGEAEPWDVRFHAERGNEGG